MHYQMAVGVLIFKLSLILLGRKSSEVVSAVQVIGRGRCSH